MLTLGEKVKKLRKEKGWTQDELALKLRGKFNLKTNRVMVSKWETGAQMPEMYNIACLANLFNVSIDYLNGTNFDVFSIPGILPMPKTKKVPRLGNIACGEPVLALENFDGYDEIDEEIECDFSLVCGGDSMINARIFNGDTVFIRQQPNVDNGEIAAVCINDEATLKRVFRHPDCLELRAENPLYKPLIYRGAELNEIRILGKAVWFKSKVR